MREYRDLEEQARPSGDTSGVPPPAGGALWGDTVARALQAVSVGAAVAAVIWILYVGSTGWGADEPVHGGWGGQGSPGLGGELFDEYHRGGQGTWRGLSRALSRSDPASALLVVGGAEGTLFSARKGVASPASVPRAIASASKWLIAATILRLVEDGHLSLEDCPQRYLPFWASEPHDKRAGIKLRHLLSLTSGMTASGSACSAGLDAYQDVAQCARFIHTKYENMTQDPGEAFFYSIDNLVVAAAMAMEAYGGKAWGQLFNEVLARPLGMQTTNVTVFPPNPRNLGQSGMTNMVLSANDYARFLKELSPHGGIITGEMRGPAFADATQGARFDPGGRGTLELWFGERWHYSFGHWIECAKGGGWESGACSPDSAAAMHSSVGASGFYPVLVNPFGKHGGESYFAIVAFEFGLNGDFPSIMEGAVRLFRELQPQIEEGVRRSRQGRR